jgi:isopentenyl diphosphate isomerase/L-lactate dehydrogenase-like FMN-dependent dehydrogenase
MCLSTIASMGPAEVREAAPGATLWMQLYVFRDRGVTAALVEEAIEAGVSAIVVTVDAPRAGRRERDLRAGFEVPIEMAGPSLRAALGGTSAMSIRQVFAAGEDALGWSDLEQLAAGVEVPVLVKGVMTREDAEMAVEHGLDGVVVSNHGGRQLDAVAATIDVLPEVVEAVDGRIEVLMDGGVRRGTDVIKAMALGAGAVLVGRPPLWGLAVDGERGAARVLELLHQELEDALVLCGCPSPEAVTAAYVERI